MCDAASAAACVLLPCCRFAAELEPITRRATLDVIGRAGFGHDFGALQMAQQQQQQQDQVDIVKVSGLRLLYGPALAGLTACHM